MSNFSHQLDVQVRYDNRSNRPSREQYRLRYYPSVALSNNWSINSFIVTGDGFSSSHNTFGTNTTDYLYARRLYARYQADYGKTEVGIIPTFKGRVSSTGLSKDGWITGLRQVNSIGHNSALEIVVGQLSNAQANQAFSIGSENEYIEVEYSARMGEQHSYEVSLERLLKGSFVRGEYRYRLNQKNTFFLELVQRTDEPAAKVVVGTSGELSNVFSVSSYPIDYFVYYSYIDTTFGPRAELIEDFLGTGHGGSVELSGVVSQKHALDWFVRVDTVNSISRVLAGLKLSLD